MTTTRDDELHAMADAWRAHLTRSQHITFAPKGDLRRYVMAAGSQILNWFGLKTGEFEHMLKDVTFTLPPIPGLWTDPVVLMAERLEDSPIDDMETATHEGTHGRDLGELYRDVGPLPAVLNYSILYATEKEARARCEGKAYVAGLYAKYRLTGRIFAPADITARMHRIYALGEKDLSLVDDMTRSDVKSIERAEAPPHFMALEFGAWAEDTHPHLLAPLPGSPA
jgi:hypothetical protein